MVHDSAEAEVTDAAAMLPARHRMRRVLFTAADPEIRLVNSTNRHLTSKKRRMTYYNIFNNKIAIEIRTYFADEQIQVM